MENDRREFLKKVGLGTLVGLGAATAINVVGENTGEASSSSHDPADKAKVRFGMVVDMRKCKEDCTDCIDACHLEHNVPDLGNTKEEVKWIWKEKYHNVFPNKTHQFVSQGTKQKPFLTLCNQCLDAPCVRVCPTQATFKRPDGIVQMDFHRCIGCRFCMAGCPYGSRSFNWRDPRPYIKEINPKFPTRERGVVEKCNFCAERLAKGKIPSCVEVCKEKVLVFGNLNDPDSEIRKVLKENHTIQRKPELGTNPSVFYIV